MKSSSLLQVVMHLLVNLQRSWNVPDIEAIGGVIPVKVFWQAP